MKSRTDPYPKVLICALTRINNKDSFNNNLLLRNLFAEWPRERLAQIYSGGNNGDDGYCGHQYQIGPRDRRFGNIFNKLKSEFAVTYINDFSADPNSVDSKGSSPLFRLKQSAGRFIMNSGLYELLFKLRTSRQLVNWVKENDPDIILAQGYNLSFTWLPIYLKRLLRKPLAYYSTDDWPFYLYASRKGLCFITAPFMRRVVERSANQLITSTDLPFAFNELMGKEYEKRYGKIFTTLMHCDDPDRFINTKPIRLHPPEIKSIVAAGAFDNSRWSLLLDLEEVCQRLNNDGIRVKATVLATRIAEEGYLKLKSCEFVELRSDPGHDLLPAYLKGADLLFLAETFNADIANDCRYSISTKAHLFMFSQQPIIVYGHPDNGLVKYASHEGWACVVYRRNIDLLKNTISDLLFNEKLRQDKKEIAYGLATRNNSCIKVRQVFLSRLIAACQQP